MTILNWQPGPFGGNGVLGIATNWAPGFVPTALDTLNFNSGALVTALTGTATALNANFGGPIATTWTLSGAQLNLGGLLTVSAGATLSGSGTVTGTIADNGTIMASGGLLTLSGPVSGTGQLQIAAGATLDINSTSLGEQISFLGSTGTLIDSQAGPVAAAISGFGTGDTIDLSSLTFQAGATATIAGGVLTVTSGAATETLSLAGIGNGTTFSVTADASGGTDIAILGAAAPPPPVITVPTPLTWNPPPLVVSAGKHRPRERGELGRRRPHDKRHAEFQQRREHHHADWNGHGPECEFQRPHRHYSLDTGSCALEPGRRTGRTGGADG